MTVSLHIRKGTRVLFEPTPASYALYSKPPRRGMAGTVTPVSLGSGRRTYLPGPGGGLVYVNWDDGSFQGVSSLDLVKLSGSKLEENPIGAGAAALVAAAVAGIAWLILKPKKTSALVPTAPPTLPPTPQLPQTPQTLLPATVPGGQLEPPKLDCQGKALVTYKFAGIEPLIKVFRRMTYWVPQQEKLGFANLPKHESSAWAPALIFTGTDAAAALAWIQQHGYEDAIPIGAPEPGPSALPSLPIRFQQVLAEGWFFVTEFWVQTVDGGWCMTGFDTNYGKFAPPPPPPGAAAPALAGLGQVWATKSTYTLKRLYVWSNGKWVLEDQESTTWGPAAVESGVWKTFMAQPAWDVLWSDPPPYYYVDYWLWGDGGWKSFGCSANYKAPGCTG